MKKDELKKEKKVIIEGIIIKAKYGATKFDDNNKYRITIKSDNIPFDEITAFENVGPKMTPSWYKDRGEYINLASIYSIPIQTPQGKRIDFDDWLDSEVAIGSTVKCSIRQKDGAVYPMAIKVLEDGEPYDPFIDM